MLREGIQNRENLRKYFMDGPLRIILTYNIHYEGGHHDDPAPASIGSLRCHAFGWAGDCLAID